MLVSFIFCDSGMCHFSDLHFIFVNQALIINCHFFISFWIERRDE